MNENESLTVTLTLDDNRELECDVLTIFEAGGREYIALLPPDDSEDGGQVYLYRFISGEEDEEPELENITDDEEFSLASDAFNEWMENQDFGDIDLDALNDLDALE